MKFSTKTRYGIRTILEIALCDVPTGINQKDIAANQDISYKYLDHIVHSLKVAKLITKAHGYRSGYILCKEPKDITMLEIHNAFEPQICVIDCLSGSYACSRLNHCASKGFWGKLNTKIIEHFQSVTLQDLIEDQTQIEDNNS